MAVEDQVPEKEQSIEEKPQVIEEKKEEKKEEYESAQEFYDAGFEKFGEEMGGGEEEIAPKKKAAKDEECVGCGKDIAELPTEIDQVLWDRVDSLIFARRNSSIGYMGHLLFSLFFTGQAIRIQIRPN